MMRTRRRLSLVAFTLATALASLAGSAQGLDGLLQFANAGKAPAAFPVSTVRDGQKVAVGTTAADGSVGIPADVMGVASGVRTAIYRNCDDEILLVPEGGRAEDVRTESCDYERVALFPWGQGEAAPIELHLSLAASALGALQVVIEQDGQPVPGARVAISQDGIIVTDRGAGATGTAMFPLAPGDYMATISSPGQTVRGSVTVEPDTLTSVTAQTGRGRLVPNDTPFGLYRPLPTSRAERGYSVSAADLDGLLSLRVDSPAGSTFLAFPATVAPGEVMSWSAITAPSGADPDALAEHGAQLAQQVVTIGGRPFALSDSMRWSMDAPASYAIGVGDNRPRIEFQLPFAAQPSRTIRPPADEPVAARAGWPVRIPGTFDGRFDSTSLSIGGSALDVLAESPTAVYFNPPLDLLGVRPVTIGEGGESRQVSIRNIGLDLSVDQDDLWRGQSTPLHVTATGLAGITRPAFLALINQTTSVISMTQGNAQFWLIHPRDVAADGRAAYERAVQGIRRGPFSVDGILMVF